MKKVLFLLILTAFSSACIAQSFKAPSIKETPKIFVSGNFNDLKYLKEQIPVVDYVNDRKDADVHILVTSQSTGSGGSHYILYLYGQNQFAKINDTVNVTTNQIDSEDLIRGKLTHGIKSGLFRYLRNSVPPEQMSINFPPTPKRDFQEKTDPWDFWVFRTSIKGNFDGEASQKNSKISGSFSANRTTEDLRLNFGYSTSYKQNTYSYDVDNVNYEYTTIVRSHDFEASLVKSVSNHWSLGTWGEIYSSTYGNIDMNYSLSGGIEYNLFPYTESSQKQLRFSYRIGSVFNKYCEETIYFKKKEALWNQSLQLDLSLTQPWGSVSFGLSGSDYLHDLSKYNLSLFTYFSLKLIKGLSLNCMLDYSKIRNQVALARSGASVEDVLLKIRQLGTQYSYMASVGISYSFGSIFNSIVNPRFGGGGTTIYYE